MIFVNVDESKKTLLFLLKLLSSFFIIITIIIIIVTVAHRGCYDSFRLRFCAKKLLSVCIDIYNKMERHSMLIL